MPPFRAAQDTRFVERKRRIDGTELTFDCDLVDYHRRRTICVFRSSGTFRTTHFTMFEGSLSHGFFWPRRPYILYRITDPDGTVAGYRFDVVDQVRVSPRGASYRDLILDAWVRPDGRAELEDEDELVEAVRSGQVDEALRAAVVRTGELLLREHRRIIAEVEADLAAILMPVATAG